MASAIAPCVSVHHAGTIGASAKDMATQEADT